MNIETYALSNVGKVRKNNEDAFLLSTLSLKDGDKSDNIYIAVVLDGMGGLAGGELASYYSAMEYIRSFYEKVLGIENIFQDNNALTEGKIEYNIKVEIFGNEKNEKTEFNGKLKKNQDGIPETALKYLSKIYYEKLNLSSIEKLNKFYKNELSPLLDDIIKSANNKINKIQKEGMNPPGTTLTGGIFFNNKFILTNIGDSRAYRFRELNINNNEAELKRISKDHSYVQELIDQNVITREEARFHPNKNIVTRCIGVNKEDTPDHYIYSVKENDIFLLSSDGLHDMMSDTNIAEIIKENKSNINNMADKLIESALKNGGHDNVTVVIVKSYE